MKATIVIDDGVFVRVKHEAARRKSTISSVIESAVRQSLDPKPMTKRLRRLPAFHRGKELVDVADRDALYTAMESGPVHG
jgi:hypothetical protein